LVFISGAFIALPPEWALETGFRGQIKGLSRFLQVAGGGRRRNPMVPIRAAESAIVAPVPGVPSLPPGEESESPPMNTQTTEFRGSSGAWTPLALGLLLFILGPLGCATPEETGGEPGTAVTSIEEVLAAHNEELLALDGVIGTGIYGQAEDSVIFVIVENADDESLGRIPQRLEGYPVVTVDAEQIREMTGLQTP
jgi:hypothetical protein